MALTCVRKSGNEPMIAIILCCFTVLKAEALEEVRFSQAFETLPNSKVATSRYMATIGGVFRVSPGMVLGRNYDATQEPWYSQSMLYQDRCVVTRAGYSPSGARDVVSLSHSIHTAKYALLSTPAFRSNYLPDLLTTYLT